MNEKQIRKQLTQRMSLRSPQEKSLDILGQVVNNIELSKTPDLQAQLAAIQSRYENVKDFERGFPSLCFAVATGVGKTRLMGAFISYLVQTRKSNHFFVLAPNTTIYSKLITDFSQGTSKYVFKGVSEFAQKPPLIVTGDTWEQGHGVQGSDMLGSGVIINIFNIDKINKGKGKMRKMHEIIGESYFEYLAGLPDLVMLMDEAHRYRAKAAFNSIKELQPILGLELTATPKSVGSKSKSFQNVIYEYGLGNAMADGFVKEPAVVTRQNFDSSSVSAEQLEKIKLEDAVHCHEDVKAKLIQFARNTGQPEIHPFILVVAQDTHHASDLRQFITSEQFFNGRYAGKVIEVHSKTRGEESDEATERLLAVERDPNTEIVIHVNKLKEGWDVNNLYTIVPLRASASDILTEQTLGRGLRLPYGHRVGDEAVDGLKIIAHDRFDAVIAKAREADSLVRIKAITVGDGGDIAATDPIVKESKPTFENRLKGPSDETQADSLSSQILNEKQKIHGTLLDVLKQMETRMSGGLRDLTQPEVQQEIAQTVTELTMPEQRTLEGLEGTPDIAAIVSSGIEHFVQKTIEIPHITVVPKDHVNFGFNNFDLENLEHINFQPIDDDIQITQLRTEARSYLARPESTSEEELLENYIVRHLIDFDEIDYDAHAELLNKLAGQMIAHLKSYLNTKKEVENVCLAYGSQMAKEVFGQMQEHVWETKTEFDTHLVRAYQVETGEILTAPSKDHIQDFSNSVAPLSETRKYIFEGFSDKACSLFYKFDSDPERQFAVLIDKHTSEVNLWMRPSSRSIEITWEGGKKYEPDFIVETKTEKLIVEIKADKDLADSDVQKKRDAACHWVDLANKFAKEQGKKKWRYLLIGQNNITESASLSGLIAKCTQTAR
ncbi:MAG: DEAD/DEAH box helicase family protein [Gammaproteobacteria bacterium AqS3]|nr:DEAD/DEAH box helicase family protein [Gammaproteobacteria bacterium AqS3]